MKLLFKYRGGENEYKEITYIFFYSIFINYIL
jgi:hypothetical protein